MPWERIDTTKQKTKKKKRVARREPPLLTCKIKRACKQKIYTNNKICKKKTTLSYTTNEEQKMEGVEEKSK